MPDAAFWGIRQQYLPKSVDFATVAGPPDGAYAERPYSDRAERTKPTEGAGASPSRSQLEELCPFSPVASAPGELRAKLPPHYQLWDVLISCAFRLAGMNSDDGNAGRQGAAGMLGTPLLGRPLANPLHSRYNDEVQPVGKRRRPCKAARSPASPATWPAAPRFNLPSLHAGIPIRP